MKDGIRFVTSIASNPYTNSNTLSSLAHPFVEGCVATSPITCNFIECIAALLIKESIYLVGKSPRFPIAFAVEKVGPL